MMKLSATIINHYANVRGKIHGPSQWQHLGTFLMLPKFKRVFNNIKITYKCSSRSIPSQLLLVSQAFKSIIIDTILT